MPVVARRQMKKPFVYLLALLPLALLLVAVYYLYHPEQSAWFPRCPFLAVTGWKCFGCGSQRFVHALLHADFRAAWHYNALLFAALPYLLLLLVSSLWQQRFPRLHNALRHRWVLYTIVVLLLVWLVVRNLYGW